MKRVAKPGDGAMNRSRQKVDPNTYTSNSRMRTSSRLSDASMASSRPSSIGIGGRFDSYLPTDKASQAEVISTINAFLASRNSILSLKFNSVPSGKEITETLIFVLSLLDFPVSKLEDDLVFVLKALNCPFKVNKTALRAPNTPHNWPSFLAVIHWLVQTATYKNHLEDKSEEVFSKNYEVRYSLESYIYFLEGKDEEEEICDSEIRGKLEKQRDTLAEANTTRSKHIDELTQRNESLKQEPTAKEKAEKEIASLELDKQRLEETIENMVSLANGKEKELDEASKALSVKMEEKRRLEEENSELIKQVDEQSFNARDAERMKRELVAIEGDIEKNEKSRNSWEEKTWDIELQIGRDLQELEDIAIECNLALKKLKLKSYLEYSINPQGSTPSEIIGFDFKTTVKPEIASLEAELEKVTTEKLDESIVLENQLAELSSSNKLKRDQTTAFKALIEEADSEMTNLRKESEEYCERCETEGKRMVEEVQYEEESIRSLKRGASEIVEDTTRKLEEAKESCEERIQKEAGQLLEVVDGASKYKEQIELILSTMKNKLRQTSQSISYTKLP